LIGGNLTEAHELNTAFKDALPPTADPLLEAFEATVGDPDFPGALFVWPGEGVRPPVFYAAAQTQGQWRRLRPLLLAFAGPTLTDFAGEASRLDPNHRHEQVLGAARLAAVARMAPTTETAGSTERALHRLIALVAKTPPDAEPPMETTGRILARIRDHLNALAIDDARHLLDRCRLEHRLDALNLKFLEIEIMAAARDWAGISKIKGFDDLCRTRRPPAVTSSLLEAIYWTTFADSVPSLPAYVAGPRPRVRDLVRLPAPAGMRDGAWRLFALEALAQEGADATLANVVAASGADLGGLADALGSQIVVEAVDDVAPAAPAVTAAEALIVADVSGSLSAIDQARALLASLTDEERAAVFQSEQPRRALQTINETFGSAPHPQDWPAWLGELKTPTFTTAQAIARQGGAEWEATLGDPTDITRLADALISVPDNPPASDRLIEAIPHLVAWLQRDPEFPRPVGYSVYEAALERLMLSGRTAAPMLDSAGVLARAMLSIGPAAGAYGRLLSDLLEFSGQAAGVRTAYWLMELVEETVAANTPDQPAREQFWQSVVSRLVPVGPQLSALQRASLSRLAVMLGWEGALPEALTSGPGVGDSTLATSLAGKLVAIYTLTESAGAQAVEALLALAPEVDIRVNSDFGGSRPLRALAENADLFVVVAASATHAATDFIRAKRGPKPLRYAAGRGAISILRAVEEWALRPEVPHMDEAV
jgi:hypothetical protein